MSDNASTYTSRPPRWSRTIRWRPRTPKVMRRLAAVFATAVIVSATTFAAATVLQQHLGYKAGVPTYLIASYVAASRLHDNRHFASDVIFGAATGIVVGRSVTWHGRNFYASPMLVPNGAGVLVQVKPSSMLPSN